MNTAIYSIIRQSIIDSTNARIESARHENEYRNIKKIGTEVVDYSVAPRPGREEFINPKTGRVNHRWNKNWRPKYIYTQEHFEKDLEKEIAREFNGYHHYQVHTDDSTRCFNFSDNFNPSDADVQKVYDSLGEYADHLIAFEVEWYNYYGNNAPAFYSKMKPIFEPEYQKKFWETREDYMNRKQAWCDKYGCD